MIVAFVLLLASLAGIVAALGVPGLSDLLLLAGPCAVASLILVLHAAVRGTQAKRRHPQVGRTGTDRWPAPQPRQPKPTWSWTKATPTAPKWIVVDGSNVMHWKDGTPQIETVREVLALLTARGYTAGVVFDANAGYLISDRYQHHGPFARMLGLPEDRVMVVPKGEPADATVLLAARDLGARVVTNDRYRDWAEPHPEVRDPGYLIRGGYDDGRVWLALDDAAPQVGAAQVPAR